MCDVTAFLMAELLDRLLAHGTCQLAGRQDGNWDRLKPVSPPFLILNETSGYLSESDMDTTPGRAAENLELLVRCCFLQA